MVDLTTNIGELVLKNPIMPASGTFSDELANVFDIGKLGAHVAKTITEEIRSGNPTPRVSESGNNMLNSIGIPSKGIENFKKKILPLYSKYKVPFVASVSAPSADGFAYICEEISVSGVDAIEINISCPNIEDDGRAFAMRPTSTLNVIKKVRSATDLPIWAKLTPNTGETIEVALAAQDGGANALVVANTILAMQINIKTYKPTLGNIMGGLSGPGLKPIIVRMVYQCSKVVDIPIIGCGGISNYEDVIEFILAGASAVQIGTATFVNPNSMTSILSDITNYCNENKISKISNLIGLVEDGSDSDKLALMEIDI
jgi:dihydroorotate dehydrogenase (NAD+) catalytic subunit